MRKSPFLIPIVILLAASCTVEDPVQIQDFFPLLSEPSVPDTLYADNASGTAVSVRAADPQGLGDIVQVECFVFLEGSTVVSRDTLLDNGQDGDILPNDGLYFRRVVIGIPQTASGSCRVGFLAVDRNGNRSDTAWVPSHLQQGTPSSAPEITGWSMPAALPQSALDSVSVQCRVFDPDGTEDIDSVFAGVYPPYAVVPAGRLLLGPSADGGIPSDTALYSFFGSLTEIARIPGNYAFRFQAKDRRGFSSPPRVAVVRVEAHNDPPVLDEPSVPDTVSRFQTEPYFLSIRVGDPQGLADIKRVYFNTTKPDGKPSSGNPFSMFDDGTNGDLVAGDGVYSLSITITSQNALGVYRFEFFAEDLSGEKAGPVSRSIVVVN